MSECAKAPECAEYTRPLNKCECFRARMLIEVPKRFKKAMPQVQIARELNVPPATVHRVMEFLRKEHGAENNAHLLVLMTIGKSNEK